MIELAGTIFCSSILFFIFRMFPRFKVDTAQAIVFNYFTAFICGSLVFGAVPSIYKLSEAHLEGWIILCGFLFISLFIAMGISSQVNGMGMTSVSVKMSLALSAIAFVFIYGETITFLKLIGFLLSIAGVLLISFEKSNDTEQTRKIGLLVFLFIGSAGLDITLNVVKKQFLGSYPDSLFTAFGFLSAGTFGLIWLITEIIRKKRQFHIRNILGGVILGIPNYFSIYFLVRSYETTGWNDSTVLAIMNVSIVGLAAIFGIIIFKESARLQKLIGLVAVSVAILCLMLK